MGHMKVKVTLRSPTKRETAVEVEEALVDTGATWTVVLGPLAHKLGLEVWGERSVQTASGSIEADRSFAVVEYHGLETVSNILISDTYPGVLLGVVTLESLELAVDPKTGRLVRSDLFLL